MAFVCSFLLFCFFHSPSIALSYGNSRFSLDKLKAFAGEIRNEKWEVEGRFPVERLTFSSQVIKWVGLMKFASNYRWMIKTMRGRWGWWGWRCSLWLFHVLHKRQSSDLLSGTLRYLHCCTNGWQMPLMEVRTLLSDQTCSPTVNAGASGALGWADEMMI